MNEFGWIISSIVVLAVGAFLCVVLLAVKRSLEGTAQAVNDELRKGREEASKEFRQLREELSASFKSAGELQVATLKGMGEFQDKQLQECAKEIKALNESSETTLDRVRRTLDERVKEMQESNEKKLDEMRQTVDEKLNDTLEKRLGESFKLVSDRLEAVHKGLGEMQNLATGVGDLKRVLSNVKHRGTLGETQLGAILEDILAPQQYEKNVATKVLSGERVEYAIKLPGANNDPQDCVWLPIDSKFPQEDFERIQKASERGESEAVQQATTELARTIKREAATIAEKYLCPPETTDFAIMFVPTEGLYAEIVKQPDLINELSKLRVVVAGPINLMAILNSFRMGFQTLAISAQANEVWKVLAAVKTEFGKFGDVLVRVKKQLGTATKTIEETETRTRQMERKLRAVEQLPQTDAALVLGLPEDEEIEQAIENGEDLARSAVLIGSGLDSED